MTREPPDNRVFSPEEKVLDDDLCRPNQPWSLAQSIQINIISQTHRLGPVGRSVSVPSNLKHANGVDRGLESDSNRCVCVCLCVCFAEMTVNFLTVRCLDREPTVGGR